MIKIHVPGVDEVGAGETLFGDAGRADVEGGGASFLAEVAGVLTGAGGVNGLRGSKGLLKALCFSSVTSFRKFSRVVFSPGKLESIACATSRSENWFSNSAHDDAFSNLF